MGGEEHGRPAGSTVECGPADCWPSMLQRGNQEDISSQLVQVGQCFHSQDSWFRIGFLFALIWFRLAFFFFEKFWWLWILGQKRKAVLDKAEWMSGCQACMGRGEGVGGGVTHFIRVTDCSYLACSEWERKCKNWDENNNNNSNNQELAAIRCSLLGFCLPGSDWCSL